MPSKLLLESLTINPTDNNNGNLSAIRQALVVIEHKIRNLEKRKTKLESYRAIQSSGKELSNDQKAAVAKFDEVAQSLECTRDLSKQFLQLANSSEKEEKKKARKDAAVRAQAETSKVREVLAIQNILIGFEEEAVRNDFLNGTNGAVKLEESDLEHLSKFCADTQINRPGIIYEEAYTDRSQKAAEHLSFTIDGRQKAFGSTTYEYLKELFQKINECGYLESAGKLSDDGVISADESNDVLVNEQSDNADIETESNEQNGDNGDMQSDAENSANLDEQQQATILMAKTGHDLPIFEAPSAAAVPAPAFPQTQQPSVLINQQTQIQQIPQPQQMHRQPQQIPITNAINVQAQIPPQSNQQQAQVISGGAAAAGGGQQKNPVHPGHFPPTTVRAVESLFRQRQYIQQQQIRPIADVIGGGKFFFIQDSEIDAPEMLIGVPAVPTPAGFPLVQNVDVQSQNNTVGVNLPAASPTQILPAAVIPQQKQAPAQQQNLVAATIPTQTFTNQSFPPIVPQSQVQKMYSVIPAQSVGQGVAVADLQQVPQVTTQQHQQHKQQQSQLVPVFSTQHLAGMPPQLIPAAVIHHPQQQQQIQGLTKQQQRQQKQNSAGTGSPLISGSGVNSLSAVDAQQQAAAISALQQQQKPGSVPPNVQLPGFVTGKYPIKSPIQQQQQNQSNAAPKNNQNVGVGNSSNTSLGSVHPTATSQLGGGGNGNQDINYDSGRRSEQKVSGIDLTTQQHSIKDVISGPPVVTNDWETDGKLRRSGNDRQQHKTTSQHHNAAHHSHHHNSTHLHSSSSTAPHTENNTNNNNNNIVTGGESNQWSNEMHTNSQQQSTGTNTATTNNKSNEWSSSFDSNQTESNHWNNNDAAGGSGGGGGGGGYNNNNRGNGAGNGRHSFGGRNRGIRGGNGSNNGGGGGGGPTSNGYRGRSNYSSGTSSSTQQSNGGRNNNNNNNNGNNGVYFRNNDNNYYQNGGYNGGSKDRSNRYSGDNGGSTRGGPTNSVSGGGSGGNGPPPPRTNQNRSNLGGGGGMGPRGSATSGGNRSSTGSGGYGARPPRQQDLGTIADM